VKRLVSTALWVILSWPCRVVPEWEPIRLRLGAEFRGSRFQKGPSQLGYRTVTYFRRDLGVCQTHARGSADASPQCAM